MHIRRMTSVSSKILVIEDDPSAARLMVYALELEGFQVIAATDGLDGLKQAKEEEPDLIILDVMLPGLDGFEVCDRLRADSTTAQLPILILSAKAHEKDKLTGEQVGADQYIVKPADTDVVLAAVQNMLNKELFIQVSEKAVA